MPGQCLGACPVSLTHSRLLATPLTYQQPPAAASQLARPETRCRILCTSAGRKTPAKHPTLGPLNDILLLLFCSERPQGPPSTLVGHTPGTAVWHTHLSYAPGPDWPTHLMQCSSPAPTNQDGELQCTLRRGCSYSPQPWEQLTSPHSTISPQLQACKAWCYDTAAPIATLSKPPLLQPCTTP